MVSRTDTTSARICAASISARRSSTSDAAPAARQNSMYGSTVEACTSATTSAVGDSEVISQEAPTDWISPPKLEHRLASQSARKMWYLNGVRGDARTVSGRRGGESFMADENVARSGGRGHGRVVAFDMGQGIGAERRNNA